MKNSIVLVLSCVGMLFLTSCFGQHNTFPSKGVNLDSERIYGVRGGDPKQLNDVHPEDKGDVMKKRATSIREKLYPTSKENNTPVVEVSDSTSAE